MELGLSLKSTKILTETFFRLHDGQELQPHQLRYLRHQRQTQVRQCHRVQTTSRHISLQESGQINIL